MREIQELLRNIGPVVRYTQVGCELTRQTAEALVNFEAKVDAFPDRD